MKINWLEAARAQQGRLWSKIDKNGPVHRLGRCWLYRGRLDKDGYGQFMITSPRLPEKPRQKAVRPHRLVWELRFGPLPETTLLLHRCDVRNCCNPVHLFPGTQTDNVADMMRKGRQRAGKSDRRGILNAAHKLTERQVLSVVALIRKGVPTRTIADRFAVDHTTINLIRAGKTWRHLTGGPVRGVA